MYHINPNQTEIERLAAIRDAFREMEYNEAVKKQNEGELDEFAIVGTDTKCELLGMLEKSESENQQLKSDISEKDERIRQLEALLEKSQEKVEDK